MSGNLRRLGFTGENLPDWHPEGACDGRFDLDWYSETPDGIAAVKAVCAVCPIQVTCLEDAIGRREPWGVWGGLDPDERAEYAKSLGAELPTIARHGERSRYTGSKNVPGCRCEACTRAHADYEHMRRKRKAEGWTPPQKMCAYCGGPFLAWKGNQKYCTSICTKADADDRARRKFLARRCQHCGAPMLSKRPRYCSDDCARQVSALLEQERAVKRAAVRAERQDTAA